MNVSSLYHLPSSGLVFLIIQLDAYGGQVGMDDCHIPRRQADDGISTILLSLNGFVAQQSSPTASKLPKDRWP